MEYSLVVRDQIGSEITIANASYIDNILNLSFTVPVPRKPWWYTVKDAITPILLAMILFKPYRR